MNPDLFAERTRKLQRSFIREILKVTEEPDVISFAGGLPHPRFFPVDDFARAAERVLRASGEQVLQYSTTEGYQPLREWIANRYRTKKGMTVSADDILITNGSQQGLDLVGKVFLDAGNRVLLERPAYLGAIQAFGMFEPDFRAIDLLDEGIDVEGLSREARGAKLFYAVPNFGNPSGITYSLEVRRAVAALLSSTNLVLVEDDPYGELRFRGEDLPPIASMAPASTALLGSFSKIVAPGIRMGWLCAPPAVMERLITVKQGTDLHSNYLSQRILHKYLTDCDIDRHIAKIRETYGRQRDAMVALLRAHFPEEVGFTEPEGGMFLWLTLPKEVDAMVLFEEAIKERVAFVPGAPFYVDGGGANTARLNFSNSDLEKIETGIRRLAGAIKRVLARKQATHAVGR